MEGTPFEQTPSTRSPVFSKNGKAESPKPEMIAAWECSQSPCHDLVLGREVWPGFVSGGLSCKPCVRCNKHHKTTLWGPQCQPAFLCSLWGTRPACSWPHPHSFAALQLQGLSQGCWFSSSPSGLACPLLPYKVSLSLIAWDTGLAVPCSPEGYVICLRSGSLLAAKTVRPESEGL